MYIDPIGANLIHRVETELAVARAEQRRVIAERAAAQTERPLRNMPTRTPFRSIFRKTVEVHAARS